MSMIDIAAIGIGNRTRKYLKYIEDNGDKVRLKYMVDTDLQRLEKAKKEYRMPQSSCFCTSEEFFSEQRDVDAVIIGTPDRVHYEQCMKAIFYGYNILLEKPISPVWEECLDIYRYSKSRGVKVSVCYVLRYHPYYRKLKELATSGKIGRILNVIHTLNIGIDRMTHTFVRGNWSVEEESAPILLAKCCHDADMILWVTGSSPAKVFSDGGIDWFTKDNAPENSSDRCISCGIEDKCRFSAVDLYKRRKNWIDNFVIPDGTGVDEVIEKELVSGKFGRCVFKCDNNVPDRQTVFFTTTDGISVTMSMLSMTCEEGRETIICGSKGEITAAGDKITVKYLNGDKEEFYDFTEINKTGLHANADISIVGDFIESLTNKEHKSKSDISETLQSHLLCFRAEESRKRRQLVFINERNEK